MLTIGITLIAAVGNLGAPDAISLLDLTVLKVGAERTLESRRAAWDTLHAATALQGLVNRKSARLYVRFVGQKGALDQFWFARLRETWLKGAEVMEIPDLKAAIERFRLDLKGVVVWDERVPATSNIASTIAGVENLLPVRYDLKPDSLYFRLTQAKDGPKLPIKVKLISPDGSQMFTGTGTIPDSDVKSTGSAKNDAYRWAAAKYLVPGKCEPGYLGYYPDAFWIQHPRAVPFERTLIENQDFFIAKKAFIFDLGPWTDEAPDDDLNQKPGTDGETLRLLLGDAYKLAKGGFTHVGGFTPWDQKYTDFTGRKRGGVATEWHYAEVLSCFNAYMDADAPGLHAMANASVFMHEPLQAKYPQPNLPTVDSLRARGFLTADGKVAPKHYATIYVGDYDSAAWLYTMLPEVWNDPARGSIPLGWAFNPAIERRFPTGLTWARATATPNDWFVAGDSGYGYLNPGYLEPPRAHSGLPSGLAGWASLNDKGMKRWDLGIVGFVIDGNAPAMNANTLTAYAKFSPWGVVAQKVPPLQLVNGTPFLRMGSDLPHGDLKSAANLLIQGVPAQSPSFGIYRTILWKPSEHRALFEAVTRQRPDIVFVDPYTLMLLARLSLQSQRG